MLRARSIAEEHLYMRLHPCQCGRAIDVAGLGHATGIAGPAELASIFSGSCDGCGAELQFEFVVPDGAPRGRARFGGDAPSEIIDPGEFYLVSDELLAEGDVERAIACLEEVLKFIPPGEETVPSAAFRRGAGAAKKLESPGRFTRERLEARIAAYRETGKA
jgi:hypothetical protein